MVLFYFYLESFLTPPSFCYKMNKSPLAFEKYCLHCCRTQTCILSRAYLKSGINHCHYLKKSHCYSWLS